MKGSVNGKFFMSIEMQNAKRAVVSIKERLKASMMSSISL